MESALIVLNYNDSDTTSELIDQIKSYESIDLIVVVDNASTDKSFEILKKYENHKIKVMQTPKNGGYGYGNNYGFEYAYSLGAKYIGIANPDVEFSDQCFKNMLNAISEDASCGAVAPISIDINGNEARTVAWKQPSVIVETLTSSVILYRLLKNKTHYNKEYLHSRNEVEVDILPGSFLLLDANHFNSVGMYDENVFLYCEEKILGWKFAEKSIKTKLLTNIQYIHKHSISINKSIKSHIKKTNIWLDSKKYFAIDYMIKNKALKILIDLFFMYAKVEAILVGIIKKLSTYNQHMITKNKS